MKAARVSKMVIRRLKAARQLVEHFKLPTPGLFERLEELLAKGLPEGRRFPDLALLFELLGGLLVVTIDDLIAADSAHRRARLRLAAEGRRCTGAAKAVRQILVDTRETVLGAFGRGSDAALLRLRGRLPRAQDELCEVARQVLDLLRETMDSAPETRRGILKVDLRAVAEELEPAYKKLDEAIPVEKGQEHRVAYLRQQKKAAMADLDIACRGLIKVAKARKSRWRWRSSAGPRRSLRSWRRRCAGRSSRATA